MNEEQKEALLALAELVNEVRPCLSGAAALCRAAWELDTREGSGVFLQGQAFFALADYLTRLATDLAAHEVTFYDEAVAGGDGNGI